MSEQNQIRVMEVVPYNAAWVTEYINEAERIQKVLGKEIIKTHHIGSTAIPGIYAKPIIDILVEVKNIEDIDKYNDEMRKLGYIPQGEGGIVGRRFFLKGLNNRTHHVHIFQTGNLEIERHLNFRDYMIEHPEEAKAYEELKKQLAEKFRYDSEGYCEGKNNFIKELDEKAAKWSKSR